MTEFTTRLRQIHTFIEQQDIEGLLLQRNSSFAWATCGSSSYVNTASTTGAASLFITKSEHFLITNNIEAPRLAMEENLKAQGWNFQIFNWHEGNHLFTQLSKGLTLGADTSIPGTKDLGAKINQLRSQLSLEEITRFRQLGQLCAQAMNESIYHVKPGMTEYEIAGVLAQATQRRGAQAIVNLIATDERIYNFRHPLPTSKKLDKYAMLVLCGRQNGLVCSITRLVHFGSLSDELKQKSAAVARVDAEMIAATRPGTALQDVFRRGTAVYTQTGYANEWQLHHQGGATGFEPRELLATPTANDIVSTGQAYAWNPSITGTKSEDTILVGEKGNEVLTAIDDWPMFSIELDNATILRPKILEIL